jgi:hypothetical protein
MDVTPSTPGRRSRAKTKEPAVEKIAKPTVTAKKPRSRKRAEQTATASAETEAVVTATPSADELQGMIATAAYYLAAERHFSPGRELDDWLEAERRIHATLFG